MLDTIVNILNDILPPMAIGFILGVEYLRIQLEKAVKRGDIILKNK